MGRGRVFSREFKLSVDIPAGAPAQVYDLEIVARGQGQTARLFRHGRRIRSARLPRRLSASCHKPAPP